MGRENMNCKDKEEEFRVGREERDVWFNGSTVESRDNGSRGTYDFVIGGFLLLPI